MNRNINFIIIMLMISTLVFSFSTDNVEGAEGEVTLVNWDEGPVTAINGTFGKFTLKNTIRTDVDIDNSYTYSDFFQLRHYTTDEVSNEIINEAYLNLTQNYEYISEITLYTRFNFKDEVGLNSRHFHNYIYFANDSGNFFCIKVDGCYEYKDYPEPKVKTFKLYIDGDGAEQELLDIEEYHPTSDNWDTDTDIQYKIVISHVTSNLMNVSIYNLTGEYLNGLQVATLQAYDWKSFSQIKLVGNGFYADTGGSYLDTFIDDIIISTTGTTADEGSDEDEIQDYIERDAYRCTSLDRTSIVPFRFDQYEDRYLDIGFYGIVADYRVKAVELYVATEQLSIISNTLSDYDLMINGIPAGSPDYFIKVSNDMYKIRWMTGVSLNNENPIFQFKSSESHSQSGYSIDDGTYTTLNYNWYLPFVEYDYTPSLFGTGIHNTDALYGNEIVNNAIDFIYMRNGAPVNAMMCFYYDEITPITPSDRNDYIDTDKLTYSDTDENINIFGTNSDLSGTTLHIYNTDTDAEMTFYGLPYVVNVIDFNYNVKLLLAGNYNTTLERGGLVVANADFTITNNITDYWMATEPNPSDDMDNVILHYMFNHSNTSADVKIVLSSSQYLTDTYAYIEQWYKPSVILDNDYHDITNIVINQEGLYYFIMAVETQVGENTYWTPVNVYEHVVKEKQYENSIDILTPEITLNTDGYGYASVEYIHNHLGSENIFLYLNGIETVSVKDYSFGIHTFKVSKAGYYNVSLVFIEDDGDIVTLDYGLFEAIGEGVIPDDIKPIQLIPTEYYPYVIMIIIGLFAVMPMGIMATLGTASIFLEPVFISLGVALCIMLGLLELWFVLFIIFIITATIVGWLIWR